MSAPVFGMTDYDFRITLKKIKRAIIPVGSLEQHGAHLPVSTDSLIAEYTARLLAEKIGAFVLPVISCGVSFEHKPMFNVSLRNSTLSTMLCDTCISLAENKIREIIILNGHHGNTGAIQYIPQEIQSKIRRLYWQLHLNLFTWIEPGQILKVYPNQGSPTAASLTPQDLFPRLPAMVFGETR
jgi:creatinine amidohydrolase/Fe(II)-dependent formamide hydrolase-like protein